MKVSILSLVVAALAYVSTTSAFSDSDILNFALNLECLEAEFYSWAALGHGLTETQRGGGPPSVGGMKANLGDYQAIAEEIASNEITHVELLRSALGSLAVPCPAIDIGTAFSAAADAALGTTLSPPFSPYSSFIKFLHGALLFEDVGVTAYNGAIGVIRDPAYLAAARSIMAVEAYHGGIIRSKLADDYNTIVKPYGVPVSAIIGAIGPAVGGLLGLPMNALTVGSNTKMPNLVPVNMYAEAYAVTPDKILNVVYLSPTATMGGFFPSGVNGLLGKTRGMLVDICMGSGKVMRYQQCGGKYFMGPTCCEGYNTCVMKNENYSNCKPFGVPADMVMWYGQCGGKNYMGPTKCEPMSACTYVNEYYSQCKPMKM